MCDFSELINNSVKQKFDIIFMKNKKIIKILFFFSQKFFLIRFLTSILKIFVNMTLKIICFLINYS